MHKDQDIDYIFVKNLEITMFTGIYDKEKENAQRVILNIDIQVQSNKNKALSGIDDVVSYENICDQITALAETKHFELLEEFCEEVANTCLVDKRVMSVLIKAEKPDIIENTFSVGVRIQRTKQH